ncbi:MAG TPA: hypothetical protein VFG13_05810 [Blastococcus sp.]|nr:hypothetical protein [Blastococcus sp.]
MELLLSVINTAGRLNGTARRRGCDAVVAFSGSLELLACIERLCQDEPGPGTPAAASTSTNRES